MKDEIKNLLLQNINDILIASKNGAGNAIDMLYAQCPDLINQITQYAIIYNMIIILTVIINLIVFVCVLKYKTYSKIFNDNDDLIAVYSGVWGGVTVIGIIVFFVQFGVFLKALIAPKMYILEYIKSLLN